MCRIILVMLSDMSKFCAHVKVSCCLVIPIIFFILHVICINCEFPVTVHFIVSFLVDGEIFHCGNPENDLSCKGIIIVTHRFSILLCLSMALRMCTY